jgi:YidC/Oxa1 family membrane protein insertase
MRTLLKPLMFLEESVLEGLHAVGIGWGLAIVGLTLLVRLALLPMAIRQAGVRRRLALHAPQLRELRARHRDDVVAQQAELAAYRKQHGLQSRGAVTGLVIQLLVVISLALLLRGDAAAGTFGDAGWLFIDDLSEPAAGTVLVLLIGGWVALQLVSMRLRGRVGLRRIAISLLAPIPLLAAATQIPAGVLLYLLVSSTFAIAQKLALRAPAAPLPARTLAAA